MFLKTFACAALLVLSACGGNSVDMLVGYYGVSITAMDRTDTTICSLTKGTGGSVLVTFIDGIWTDPTGPSPNGLRATVDGNKLNLASQPATVLHSTGRMTGSISGEGSVTSGALSLALHFTDSGGVERDFAVSGNQQ